MRPREEYILHYSFDLLIYPERVLFYVFLSSTSLPCDPPHTLSTRHVHYTRVSRSTLDLVGLTDLGSYVIYIVTRSPARLRFLFSSRLFPIFTVFLHRTFLSLYIGLHFFSKCPHLRYHEIEISLSPARGCRLKSESISQNKQ